jgi:predicted Zn-dependent peptidase
VKYSLDEVGRMASRDDRISEDELAQAKGILALGKWQGSLDGVLMASGTYAAETVRYGTTERLMAWPGAVQAVTSDQVKSVAAKYLAREAMATVVIGPLEKIRQARHPRWPVSLDDLSGRARTARAGTP